MRLNPLNNLSLKIGAVALALLLWFHVATNKTYEYQFDIPIKVTNIPAGLVMVSDMPENATVRIKTTGKQLIAVASNDHAVTIDASQFHEGSFDRDLTEQDAASAFTQIYEGTDIVFPKKLFLRFEKIIDKNLLVESRVKARAKTGFVIAGRPKIEPETIQIWGPSSLIRTLKFIETESMEINDVDASTSFEVSLVIPDSTHVSLSDSTITLSYKIESLTEYILSDITIVPPQGFDNSHFSFVPKLLTLKLGLPGSLQNSLDGRKVKPTFAAPNAYRDSLRVAIKYALPNSVSVIEASTDSVTIVRRK